jgi:hypothetical protein
MIDNNYYKLLYDVLQSYDRCTPLKILRLRHGQVFVFGTDAKGSQRYGAAGLAAKNFGAQVGVKNGRTGDSYALPTMGCSFNELGVAILEFEEYARDNMETTFLVTPIGCGHAGFKAEDVAPYFRGCIALGNVMLPEKFLHFFRKECIEKLHIKETMSLNNSQETDYYLLYDESVHPVLKYLEAHSIPFSKDGGFSLVDENDSVIAEAELCIESEKIVFSPIDQNSEKVLVDAGYTIMTVNEYLTSKS